MATIYTARSIVGNDKPTPLFNLKGLVNYAPASISNLNIQGIPLERQVAYIQYSANVSAFIYASLLRKTVTISPRPYGLVDVGEMLPLNPPTVSFTLAKALDSDRSDKLVNNLGPGASKTQSGKTTIYHAPALPKTQLASVIAVSTQFFNAGRDAVNPRGMKAYTFLNQVIRAFLHVHSYPAFRDEDPESITVFENLVQGSIGADYYARTYTVKDKDGKEVERTRDMLPHSYELNENGKRDRSEDDMDEDGREARAQASVGYVSFRGNDTVFKAKPTYKPISNIGSSSNVPQLPGLVFPYFPGLIQPDAVFMNNMVLRRFYQLMGATHEKCQAEYVNIRHGINSLATTARGMELCHMMLGIDLAIDTQSRCFIIIDKNVYHGFVLLGSRFALFANTKWYASASEKQLTEALSRMDPHESAVSDIIQKMEKLQALDQYHGQANRAMFAEPETLVAELSKLKVNDIDSEDIRDLDRLVRSLNYMGTGYLSQNPQMIADVLATLNSNADITMTRPTYIPSVNAPFSNRHYRILARFGPEAPSFWNDRGTEIMCKSTEKSVATTGGKRKVGEKDIFGNMPGKILITPKPLLMAVRDMDRVVDQGRVKMDEKERAGRYRNISLEHEDTRKAIWSELVKLCSGTTKKPKVSSDHEDDEDGGINIDEALLSLLS